MVRIVSGFILRVQIGEKADIMENSKTARTFLGFNAVFSLLIGVDFVLVPDFAAGLIFIDPAGWPEITIRILGIGLILFGAGLTLVAMNRFVTKGQVLFITSMDAGWVLGSAGVLVLYGHLFTTFGQIAVIVVAGFVAVFALGQFIGARRIALPLSRASVTVSDRKILATVDRTVDAPQEVVWRVMNDHPGYADVADNISKVEVVKGDGIGMQRRCFGPKGENWLETCDLYEDGRAYGFRIHTEADDYPYPISDLRGEWSVEPDGNGSRFAIRIEAVPKGNLFVQTMFKMAAKRQFKAVLVDLADAWADRMERESRA